MVEWMDRWMKRLKSGWKEDGNMEERKEQKDEWMNERKKGNKKK